jgi:hypothetical protein
VAGFFQNGGAGYQIKPHCVMIANASEDGIYAYNITIIPEEQDS